MRDYEMPAYTVESVARVISHALVSEAYRATLIDDLVVIAELQQQRVSAAREPELLPSITAQLERQIETFLDRWAYEGSETELVQLLRMSLYRAELGEGEAWKVLLRTVEEMPASAGEVP